MKKATRRIISVVLSAVIMISCFSSGLSAGALTEPAQTDGGVYIIANADDLIFAMNNPAENYLLLNDIDVSAEDIMLGSAEEPFSGSFNGCGHSITIGINKTETVAGTYYTALFGSVSGTVSNLIVNGSINATIPSGYVGGIAATLDGGRIMNCVSNVNITALSTGLSHVGGIAGAAFASGEAAIENCTNNGTINNSTSNTGSGSGVIGSGTNGSTGGILSFVCDGAGAKVTRCINNGSITVNGGKENIGGVVGQTSSNLNSSYVNITYCANKGEITGYNIQGERAAGIIAYVKSGAIDYCYNTGNVTEYTDNGTTVAKIGYGNAFGIFGYANLFATTLSVTYCYNASEKAMQGEICTVREPSKCTFKNFYMSGRTEYATINSNASAGTAGTTFTDAQDLYTKLTADENGAAAYCENAEGYPILNFEKAQTLHTDDCDDIILVQNVGVNLYDIGCVVTVNNKYTNVEVNATVYNGDKVSRQATLPDCESAAVSGNLYAADDESALYSITFGSVDENKFTTVEIEITSEDKSIYKKTVTAEELLWSNGIEIPFEGLPLYPDGTISSNIYNCGPGNANDKLTATDTDSKMAIISSTSLASFESYAARLQNKGFELNSERTIESNKYYSFKYNGKLYYMYFTAYSNQVRIIEDNSSTILPDELDYGNPGDGSTELYQYSIDYTEGEGQTSKLDYWKIDCGMMYILKFADNSLFIIDGGHERQSSKYMMECLNNFLYEITGTPEGEKIDIRGWYISHAHGDHVYLTHAFLEEYHDNYNLYSTVFNIPSYQSMSNGYDSGTFLMKDTINKYYPDCENVKLHTGEQFSVQGVNFDVIFTHEDSTNANGTTKISDFNASSTVVRITIDGKSFMMLGDTSTVSEQEMLKMYSAETLKSDAVQAAHHGFNDVGTLYNAVAANLALVPDSEANSGATSGNSAKFAAMMNAGENTVALFAEKYTYKLTVENGEIVYEALPSYRDSIESFNIPELDASMITPSVEPVVDLETVTAKDSLLDYVIDKSINGTESASVNEPCSRILDGSTDTKFCTKTTPSVIAWTMKEAVTLSSYVIYTANDNAENAGRNPKNWVLCGSNDGENWSIIDAVSDANLPDTNYTGVAFNVDSPEAYKFYVIKFFSTDGANVLQVSEIGLYADKPVPDYVLGDLDKDGNITVSDIVELRKIIMNENPDDDQLRRGDMDTDGKLTVSDVVALRMKIMNG